MELTTDAPTTPHDADGTTGLTKREHFAAHALAGLAARPPGQGFSAHPDALARKAVRMADALIDALNDQ